MKGVLKGLDVYREGIIFIKIKYYNVLIHGI